MIALFSYQVNLNGMKMSQYSVRAGDAHELGYQIFYRDGVGQLLQQGLSSRKKSIREQFEKLETIYQAHWDGTLTLDMIKGFEFSSDLGGFKCLVCAETAEEKDDLCDTILYLSEKKRAQYDFMEKKMQELVGFIQQSKDGETKELCDQINSIHHVL